MFGSGWESVVERTVPGAIEQAIADADVFYEEQPALVEWPRFLHEIQLRRIRSATE
jgi:hypothetical protein